MPGNSPDKQSDNSSRREVHLGEVHFPDPPFGGFTYRIPEDIDIYEPGIRVRVPFGPRYRIGFLTRLFIGVDDERYRNIKQAIDLAPVVTPDVLKLAQWIADYYLCEVGDVLKATVPSMIRPSRRVSYRLSPMGESEKWINGVKSPEADLWRALAENPFTMDQIRKRFKDGEAQLARFRQKRWIDTIDSATVNPTKSMDIKWLWSGEVDFSDAVEKLPAHAVRLKKAIELFRQHERGITQREISKIEKGLGPSLRNLLKRGWLTFEKVPRSFLSAEQNGLEETAEEPPELTPDQSVILDEIRSALREGNSKPFLLHGVTGSGKTIVYLETAAAALESGMGVIIMVPEISLTPQLVGRFRRRFGDAVVLSHSGLSPRERRDVWMAVKSGAARVIIGPRSVVFAPVDNLGLIIIDEEHDESYKQADPVPRYNGRDVAIYRAVQNKAVVLIGSATPDVSVYHNAIRQKYNLLELPERYKGISLPSVWVVKWGIGSEGTLFHPKLLKRLEDRLTNAEQIILLLNRRGFSSCIRCPDCGEVASCPNCDITLRYHRVGLKLECHYCGLIQKAFDLCPVCRGSRLNYGGVGTQRVEKDLKRLFPDARIARMDLDTTRRRGAHQELLTGFARHEFDILLGTKMVAKGHDFPGVTLVGILAADLEWLRPDFRCVEKAFRLLVQASGRTGRNRAGEVVIQSWSPTNTMFRWVQGHDYKAFYTNEISSRERLKYPPFSRLVSILLSGSDLENVIVAAEALKKVLVDNLHKGRVLGPAPPPIERIESRYRRRILIKLPSQYTDQVQKDKHMIKSAVMDLRKRYNKSGIRFVIDVDPVEV